MKEGWEYKKLGEVCEVKGGKRIPKGMGFSNTKTLHPYLRVVDMKNGTIINNDIHYINDEVYEKIKRYIITTDDVYLTIAGTIGLAGTIPVELNNANLTENAAKLVFDKSVINSIYLSYYLNSCYMQGEIAKRTMAVGVPKLAIFRIEELPLAIPPLSQQQSIVMELDKINEIIDLKKAQLKDLDLLAQSIFYDMFGDPIENPKGWETKTLGEISKFRRGSFPQPYGELKWYGGEDAMPFVQVADLQDESFDLVKITKKQISKEAQPMSVFVPTGTVLVSLQGSIGKVAITQYDCYVDRTVAIFYEIDESYYTQFFFAFELKYIFEEKRKKARGISIKTITKEEFTSFDCLLPPLSLQQSFASKIQAIESQKSAIKQSLAEAETLLASRMDYYFN